MQGSMKCKQSYSGDTDSLTGCDLKDLGGEANGTFDTELLVLCTVDEVGRNYM